MSLTLKKLEIIIEAAVKEGHFHEDYLFEYEPHAAAKLLSDRKTLLDAVAEAVKRLHPRSQSAIALRRAIDEVEAGWPKSE